MNSDSKSKLRQLYRAIRAKIPASYRNESALKAAELLIQNLFFTQSQHIACYLSAADEFDSAPIIEAIWQAKKICYLPVLATDDKSLLFVKYEYGDALHRNHYSILQPAKINADIDPRLLDLTIVPLVAFDLLGHRLGMGGGYYDRSFAFLKNASQPKMLGLAYAAQQIERLPSEPWDVVLDGVITEKMFMEFLCQK
jgi:5-formyltetrahydrofolate cyclo-ligase